MELEDWLQEVGLARYGHQDDKGLHVIGTCGECKHWDSKAVSMDGWGNCDSYKVAAQTHDTDAKRHKDHGCIHWQKKQ